MNKVQRFRCIEITKKLIQHPASEPFRYPVDPTKPGFENYFQIIDDPQDLTTIERRLKKRHYRSVREWKRDIGTIWNNASIFTGSNSYTTLLAKHLESVFNKELRIMSSTTLTGWMNRVHELKVQINDLIESPPSSLKESVPIEMVRHSNLQPFMPSDYIYVFKALSTLPNQSDRDELAEILGNAESEIALTKLPLATLHSAKAFVKERSPDVRKSLLDIQLSVVQ